MKTRTLPPGSIYIEVRGGVIQHIATNDPGISVYVRDYDNEDAGLERAVFDGEDFKPGTVECPPDDISLNLTAEFPVKVCVKCDATLYDPQLGDDEPEKCDACADY